MEEVAETIASAVDMPLDERRRRMKALRRRVRKFDMYGWVLSECRLCQQPAGLPTA